MDGKRERGRRESLRRGYIELFTQAIDSALAGEPKRILFCEDVCLELYEEDGELHWMKVDSQQ